MADRDQFVKKYHKAVVMANRDRVEKMKPRIASEWIREWMDELGGQVRDTEEFREKFEEFLTKELGFAESSRVSLSGDILTIDIAGCAVCPANQELHGAGEPGMCPIISTGLAAISRVLGRNATLLGVIKEGKPLGSCQINYRLAEKP